MKFPILVDDSGDLHVFDSLESIEEYLEPIDVAAGAYKAYDREGRSVRLVISERAGQLGIKREFVTVEDSTDPASQSNELRAAIVSFLKRSKFAIGDEDRLGLSELVGRIARALEK